MNKNNIALAATATLLALTSASCSDDDNTPAHNGGNNGGITGTTISATTIKANTFVQDVMSTYYYWADEMPQLDPTKQSDTKEYFYSLLSSKDRFSYISDDAQATQDEFDGKYTDFGWEYSLSYISSTSDNVAAIITFVHDNTPASRAGARRGDIITAVNGTTITDKNYSNVFVDATGGTFSGLHYTDGNEETVSYTMTAASLTLSSVTRTALFNLDNGKKAGYLFYTSYSAAFNQELKAAFEQLKAEGAEEMILDLRYNTGGDMSAMSTMVDILAPRSVVEAGKDMLCYDYNDILESELGYTEDATMEHFADTVGINMDLSRLVVLTGGSTYSASEATIWVLKPYMDVTLVGDTTGGKNSMMYVMSPENFTRSDGQPYYSSTINNWLIMPIVAIYKNSNHESFDTSEGKGLAPDVLARDLAGLMNKGIRDLGDPEETLTAAALRVLNGKVATNKSACAPSPTDRPLASSADKRPAGLFEKVKITK